jgi:hypothetical protein
MIGAYWAVLYSLQSESEFSSEGQADKVVGFCLTLLLVRKDVTKETLVNGVGLRFAIANWLMAAWAVCFVCTPPLREERADWQSLQFFIGAEIVILINVINV